MLKPHDPALTQPRYSASDAALIARTRSQNISNWFRGYARAGKQFAPLFPNRGRAADAALAISFLELTEAIVVARFRELGVPLQRIRAARQFVEVHLDAEYPFAHRKFKVRGSRILHDFESAQPDTGPGLVLIDEGNAAGQITLPTLVQDALDLFEYPAGKDTWAMRIHPCGSDAPLSIDPHFRSGQVVVEERGITVHHIAGRFRAGETVPFIARDYEIDVASVEAALEFVNAA